MTPTNRSTDRDSTSHERRNRLYLKNGLWYFRIREGAPIGPFRYRHEAQARLAGFLEQVREDEEKMKARSQKQKPHFRIAAAS